MYVDTELLFPNYIIPLTRDMRGDEWRDLVDRVIELPEHHPETLAFVLMMIRLNGCMECETDSYRAMRGCALCVTQTLRRYKGPDSELLDAYTRALSDVEEYLEAQEGETWRIA